MAMQPVTQAKYTLFAVILCFAAALAACAPAGPSENGLHADSVSRPNWLISTFELAEQGDANSQAMLGLSYSEGMSVPQDDVGWKVGCRRSRSHGAPGLIPSRPACES